MKIFPFKENCVQIHFRSPDICTERDKAREYWKKQEGKVFFAVVWFGSHTKWHNLLFCPVGKLDRRHTGKRDNLLTREGVSLRSRSRIIRPQETLVLYKSFNTLWVKLNNSKHILALALLCLVHKPHLDPIKSKIIETRSSNMWIASWRETVSLHYMHIKLFVWENANRRQAVQTGR